MTLLAEDRLAVHELLSRYIFVIDSDRDEKTFFNLFTEDAVFEGPAGHFEGRDEIQKWLRQDEIEGYRHLTSNVFVDGDGNDAELHATFITVITVITSSAGGNPTMSESHTKLYQAGSYHCEARKGDGVWRLSKRTVKVFDLLLEEA